MKNLQQLMSMWVLMIIILAGCKLYADDDQGSAIEPSRGVSEANQVPESDRVDSIQMRQRGILWDERSARRNAHPAVQVPRQEAVEPTQRRLSNEPWASQNALSINSVPSPADEAPSPEAVSLFEIGEKHELHASTTKKPFIKDYQISGAYTYRNLSIFLIHGRDTLEGQKFLTLEEALAKEVVVLHETGSVNQLRIENQSKDERVYLQSGDIIKGGKQDRVIAVDFVVPPKSGEMPIDAFCVEQGRWRKRGSEAVSHFSSSTEQLNTKELRLAAKARRSQGEVWQEVERSQSRLSTNLNRSVQSAQSATSLQLTLEDKDLQMAKADYLDKLSPIIAGQTDVIGYAFAINGEFNSADIYGSHALFKKLWPKLVKASVVEAITNFSNAADMPVATIEEVRASLEDALKGKKSEERVTKEVTIITRESQDNFQFETLDKGVDGQVQEVHTNYIKK